MPQPKKKTSRSKRNSRRAANFRAVLPTLVACAQCSEKKPSHMVCPNCGHYKGREVFQVAEG